MKGILVGGNGAIGSEISRQLADKGIELAVVDITEGKSKHNGPSLKYFKCDITLREESLKTLNQIHKTLGNIDFVVFAQGIAGISPTGDVNEEMWDKVMDVNLKSAFFFAQDIAHIMRRQGGGKILFLSSIHSMRSYKHRLVYAASKAALNSIVRSMSIDLAEHNISVNAVAPGQLYTEMQEKLVREHPEQEELLKAIKKRTPMGRFTNVEDVAELITSLIMLKTNQLTGEIITIDGGLQNVS